MKEAMSKSIVLVLFCLLLLVSFSSRATACPPACPDCYYWDDCERECVWACTGEETCCGGSCCGNECCNDVCCGEDQDCCGGECCDPDDCCGDDCCGPGYECVDDECKKIGYCSPMYTLTPSGGCTCFEGSCGGAITETFNWSCKTYGTGCPSGTNCEQTGWVLCYTSRTFLCLGDCDEPEDCELGAPTYAPKAPRNLCGCV